MVQQVNYRTRGRRFCENSSLNLRILLAPSKRKNLKGSISENWKNLNLKLVRVKGGWGGGVEGATIPADDHAALELKDVQQPCKGILSKTYQVSFWLENSVKV